MIIVLGIAGAGKSTQCKALSDDGSFRWVSMSGLLKAHETPEIKEYMLNGIMVPSTIAIPLIEKDLQLNGDDPEILLDGFPRTLDQTGEFLHDEATPPRLVLHLNLHEEEALRRLELRGRNDDTPEAIHSRFMVYHETIDPILDSFKSRGIPVIDIDASPAPEAITAELRKVLAR